MPGAPGLSLLEIRVCSSSVESQESGHSIFVILRTKQDHSGQALRRPVFSFPWFLSHPPGEGAVLTGGALMEGTMGIHGI